MEAHCQLKIIRLSSYPGITKILEISSFFKRFSMFSEQVAISIDVSRHYLSPLKQCIFQVLSVSATSKFVFSGGWRKHNVFFV